MSTPNWGMLAKSQVDDETIEEAIARLILAHNADEEAHLGAGESLQSHKASEIIDHVVESVIEDKLANWSVSPLKFGTIIYSTIFESLDGFDITTGVAYDIDKAMVVLATTSSTPNYQHIYKYIGYAPHYWDWDHDRNFETTVRLSSNSDVQAYITIGAAYAFEHLGFKFEDGKIYGTVADGASQTTLELQAFSAAVAYNIELVYTAGVGCDFYVNGVFKGTIDTNLPTGTGYASSMVNVVINNKAAAAKTLSLSYWDSRQKTE